MKKVTILSTSPMWKLRIQKIRMDVEAIRHVGPANAITKLAFSVLNVKDSKIQSNIAQCGGMRNN